MSGTVVPCKTNEPRAQVRLWGLATLFLYVWRQSVRLQGVTVFPVCVDVRACDRHRSGTSSLSPPPIQLQTRWLYQSRVRCTPHPAGMAGPRRGTWNSHCTLGGDRLQTDTALSSCCFTKPVPETLATQHTNSRCGAVSMRTLRIRLTQTVPATCVDVPTSVRYNAVVSNPLCGSSQLAPQLLLTHGTRIALQELAGSMDDPCAALCQGSEECWERLPACACCALLGRAWDPTFLHSPEVFLRTVTFARLRDADERGHCVVQLLFHETCSRNAGDPAHELPLRCCVDGGRLHSWLNAQASLTTHSPNLRS